MSLVEVRSLILTLCVTACCFTSLTRYNINIAIVDMTNKLQPGDSANGTSKEDLAVLSSPRVPENETSASVMTTRYNWNPQRQGLILGSLFWTYMLFQIPSGVFVEWFGSRWIVTATLLGSGAVNLITPLITDCTVVFIGSRCLLGMFQAACFPGCFALLVKWMPLYERSFAFSMLRVGAMIGSVAISLMAGFLCKYLGWPFVFYVPGVMSLLAVGLFAGLTRDDPAQHPWITEKELFLIKSSAKKDVRRKGLQIPWIGILTSPAVLSYGVFKFAYFWLFFTLSTKLPSYLNDEKKMAIGSNGVINSLFNLSLGISLSITGYLSDRVIEKKLLSRTATRKAFSIVTGFGSASCLLFIPFVSAPFLMHFLLYFGALCMGFSSGGDVPLPSDMSQNYPATIFSLVNMISMISGCVAPSFAGLILASLSRSTAWPAIFVSASLAMELATIIFLLFASADRQTFDLIETQGMGEEETEECKVRQ